MATKQPAKVAIAYVHGHEVAHSWHQSLMALVAHDVVTNQRVIGGGWLATRYGTGGIVKARNDTVNEFVHGMPHVDWLMWLDTDMGFEATALDQLVSSADPESAPIVGGLCFAMREAGVDSIGGMLVQPVPTIYDWTTVTDDAGNEQSGYVPVLDYPRDATFQCAATGSAFVLIHRSAFEKIEASYGANWYTPVFNRSMNAWVSEDLSFCMRANALELPIHINSAVKTSHLKSVWLDERLNDRLERLDGS
jgi:GT2 family glycosyltransferase